MRTARLARSDKSTGDWGAGCVGRFEYGFVEERVDGRPKSAAKRSLVLFAEDRTRA
jgi:hypothetical protein